MLQDGAKFFCGCRRQIFIKISEVSTFRNVQSIVDVEIDIFSYREVRIKPFRHPCEGSPLEAKIKSSIPVEGSPLEIRFVLLWEVL